MSFADMMTLLFCLFMVLFSISSVNTSKFEALQKSLQDAFSGAVLERRQVDACRLGLDAGRRPSRPSVEPPLPSLRPLTAHQRHERQDAPPRRPSRPSRRSRTSARSSAGSTSLAKDAGLKGKVNVTVRRRGLVIQLLTDKVFFDSGDADAQAGGAHAWSTRSAAIVRDERTHPVVVEGHTDSQPISRLAATRPTGTCPALAPRRSSTTSSQTGVLAAGMSLAGLRQPGARSPPTPRADGRAKNRRVEIVLSRIHTAPPTRSQPPSAWRRSIPWSRSSSQSSPCSPCSAACTSSCSPSRPDGRAQAARRGHGLHAPEGVPGQPRRRPLREDAGRPRARRTTTRPPSPPAARAPPRRPRATAPWPRRASCATSSPTTSPTPRTTT